MIEEEIRELFTDVDSLRAKILADYTYKKHSNFSQYIIEAKQLIDKLNSILDSYQRLKAEFHLYLSQEIHPLTALGYSLYRMIDDLNRYLQ